MEHLSPYTETRRKLLDLSDVVVDVNFLLLCEDYESLQGLKELVEKIWEDSTPKMKNSTVRYLIKVMNELDLHEQKDLNGFFSSIVGERISQYQTVKK